MKQVYILFYSNMNDLSFEHTRLFQNEEDAKEALVDANMNDNIYGAYYIKCEIHESYHGEMKERM